MGWNMRYLGLLLGLATFLLLLIVSGLIPISAAAPGGEDEDPIHRVKLFNFTVVDNRLFFMVDYGNDELVELWCTFGPGNTRRLEKFQAARPHYRADVPYSTMIWYRNKLWFGAARDDRGIQLWCTPGLEGQAFPVRDDEVGVPQPDQFVIFKDVLYFSAEDRNRRQLWMTTGVADRTLPLTRSLGREPADLTVCHNRLYFTGFDSPNYREIFYINGPTSQRDRGVFPLRRSRRAGEDNDPPPVALNPHNLMALGRGGQEQLLFAATDVQRDSEEDYAPGPLGRQLWSTFGSENLLLLTDPKLGGKPEIVEPSNLTLFQGAVCFTGLNKQGRPELWYTLGNPESTYRIRGFECMMSQPLPRGVRSSGMKVYQNKLWFGARAVDYPTSDSQPNDDREDRYVQGMQLWSCTGVKGLVAPLLDRKGEECLEPSLFTVYRNKLYFAASDQFRGRQLWMSAGFRSNTFDVTLGKGPGKPPGSLPGNLIPFGDALYYIVVDEDGSVDLRLTRGQARRVADPDQEATLLIRKFEPKKPRKARDDEPELLPAPKKQ